MAEFLCARDINVLTNSFALAGVLLESGRCRVTLPGGELYRKQNIIVSAFDEDLIQRYHGRRMFMGTPAIGAHGVMESDPILIQAEQKLLRQAEQAVRAGQRERGAGRVVQHLSLIHISEPTRPY